MRRDPEAPRKLISICSFDNMHLHFHFGIIKIKLGHNLIKRNIISVPILTSPSSFARFEIIKLALLSTTELHRSIHIRFSLLQMILTLISSILFANAATAYNCPPGMGCEISDDFESFGPRNMDMIYSILDGTIWQCGQYGCFGGRSSTIQVGDSRCTLHVDGAYDRWEDRNLAGSFMKAMGENLITNTQYGCDCPCTGPDCMSTHMTPPMVFLGSHANATKKNVSSWSRASLPRLYGGETINLEEYYSSYDRHQ